MTAKPCFVQLLVFFTGKQINVSLPALLQVDLANKFIDFFEEKIVNIRSNLGTPVIPDFFRTLDTSSLTCQLVNFAPTSITELSNIANNIIMKSCIWIRFPPPYWSSNLIYFYQLSWRLSTCHWNSVIFRLLSVFFYPVYFRKPT